MSDEEEDAHTPKIQLMAKHLKEMHGKDPNFRGVVYSNYLDAGLKPMSRALQKAGIPHHVFTGEVSKKQRDQMVKDYNAGKVPVLLVSGAGSEGLDLKGTKAIQLMEPHWNESRINQVIGRGIRYKSHEHLPEHERKVKVMRYTSQLPREPVMKGLRWLTGQDQPKSVEEYMKNMSAEKERFSNQIAGALEEASNLGPLRKMGASQSMSNDEFLKRVVDQMGDAKIETVGRTRTLDVEHPLGITLKNKFDVDHMRKEVDERFNGNISEYADQLSRDMMIAGYGASGDVTKKNQQRQAARAMQGMAYGSLAGAMLPMVPAVARRMNTPGRGALASLLLPLAGGTVGFQIGKHTYKPLGIKDMVAKQTHPLLIPPKVIKQRTKLDVKE